MLSENMEQAAVYLDDANRRHEATREECEAALRQRQEEIEKLHQLKRETADALQQELEPNLSKILDSLSDRTDACPDLVKMVKDLVQLLATQNELRQSQEATQEAMRATEQQNADLLRRLNTAVTDADVAGIAKQQLEQQKVQMINIKDRVWYMAEETASLCVKLKDESSEARNQCNVIVEKLRALSTDK